MLRRRASFLAVAIVFLGGCAQKPLKKSEARAITAEVVSAAQRITGRNSEITIHPEAQPRDNDEPARIVADDISVSLSDPSQETGLTHALAAIARRHKLSVTETADGPVLRFDFESRGNRTHTIAVIVPVARRPGPSRASATGAAAASSLLAIIIDDLGEDRSSAGALLALPFPLTISVMPHLPFSSDTAERAFRRGDQVLLHLPMEAVSVPAERGEIQLRVGMNPGEVKSALAGMLDTVPYAAGVNNHEGSRATADPALMNALMPALRDRGLFFIDSRTTASTVAYDTAQRSGVRAASRKVFLDDTQTSEAVLAQLGLAVQDALRDGSAIAIGHPHPATITALREALPRLESQGIRLVFASDLVH